MVICSWRLKVRKGLYKSNNTMIRFCYVISIAQWNHVFIVQLGLKSINTTQKHEFHCITSATQHNHVSVVKLSGEKKKKNTISLHIENVLVLCISFSLLNCTMKHILNCTMKHDSIVQFFRDSLGYD